jgi:hypothetical protein
MTTRPDASVKYFPLARRTGLCAEGQTDGRAKFAVDPNGRSAKEPLDRSIVVPVPACLEP